LSHTRPIIHWVVLLTMLAAPASLSLSDCCGPDSGSDPLCGPKSLLLICSRLGVPADLDELAQLAEVTETGTTMIGLQKAAQREGFRAVGMKLSVDEIAASRVMAICHLWGDHFAVAAPGSTGIEVTDPAAEEGNQIVSMEDFHSRFSGSALLISKDPISLPTGDDEIPDLRLMAYSYSLVSQAVSCTSIIML
jgi:ABC-type bacteriocin/lantibiotic exporter with double-glycine peptidase domain